MADNPAIDASILQESTLDPQDENKKPKSAEEYMADGKVVIFFKHTGNAPELKQKKFKLTATTTFQTVIDFLRKQLKFGASDPLYLFINASFQPSPDESVADLFKCFHNNGKLVINYANTAAWG
jgi:ubiquitin-like protein ATG12